jgi:hypothetical protein
MVNTALNLVARMFNWIQIFRFNDTSRKNCSPFENSPSVSLSSLSIALYGKTWYEKNFKAMIEYPVDREKYYNDIKKLSDTSFKQMFTWNYFYNEFINSNVVNIELFKVSSINLDLVETIFNETNTFREFFDKLHYTIKDKEMLCLTLQPWIDKFINFVTSSDTKTLNLSLMKHWVIDANNITKIKFNTPDLLTVKNPKYIGGFNIGTGYKIL